MPTVSELSYAADECRNERRRSMLQGLYIPHNHHRLAAFTSRGDGRVCDTARAGLPPGTAAVGMAARERMPDRDNDNSGNIVE